VQTALEMARVAEPYIRRRAIRHLEKGRVVVLAGGLGDPFFTTDTPAALRAAEMGCDALFKGTSVDGVYTADPKKDPRATRYDSLSYREVMVSELGVMDQTAVTLCKENNLPLIVLNIHHEGAVASAVRGERVGTIVR
jgi:uridylate kinase